nr:MAG TPA: hypothetical protein [Caudoviricetes sp.]
MFSISIFSNWNNSTTALHVIRKLVRKAAKALIDSAYNTVPSKVTVCGIHGAHDFHRINRGISFFKACLHSSDKTVAQQGLHSLDQSFISYFLFVFLLFNAFSLLFPLIQQDA